MRHAAFITLVVLSLVVAAYAIAAYGCAPLGAAVGPEMRANFAAHRTGIYTHIFAAILTLIIGPLQFSNRLRNKYVTLHRWSGRVYLGIGVLVGGSALPALRLPGFTVAIARTVQFVRVISRRIGAGCCVTLRSHLQQ